MSVSLILSPTVLFTDEFIFIHTRDRVGISKTELVSMLEEEELKDAVLVVLANKQVSLGKIFFNR